jgi:hypothetical protein
MELIRSLMKRWCRLLSSGGFAELDEQIQKFRQLKYSYAAGSESTGTPTEQLCPENR